MVLPSAAATASSALKVSSSMDTCIGRNAEQQVVITLLLCCYYEKASSSTSSAAAATASTTLKVSSSMDTCVERHAEQQVVTTLSLCCCDQKVSFSSSSSSSHGLQHLQSYAQVSTAACCLAVVAREAQQPAGTYAWLAPQTHKQASCTAAEAPLHSPCSSSCTHSSLWAGCPPCARAHTHGS